MKKNLFSKFYSKIKYRTNRKYKDRLFCLIFGDERYKKNALMLYNAINGTEYTNVNDLEIYTISDAVYIKMKNDVAYLISNTIALYEQQSTINPNMPVRGFMYYGELYSKYIETHGLSVHGRRLIRLPTPQYIVFYNGQESLPERSTLKLSDAFMEPVEPGTFEWTATVYNINEPYNEALKEKCKPLNDYTILIEKIRLYSYNYPIEVAIDRACKDCIEEDVLSDILLSQRAEVMKMCITEFNEKAYVESVKQEAFEIYKEQISMQSEQISMQSEQISMQSEQISMQSEQIAQKDEQIAQLLARIKELESK